MKEIKPIQSNVENKQPSNLEAEQALLGSILVNNDIIDEVSNIINATIFYDPAHIKIYEVIQSLNSKGMIANPITLKNYFEKDNMLNDVGGTEYLVKLTRFSGSSKQAIDYAKIIHEMYLRRELVLISDKLSSDTLNANLKEINAAIENIAAKSKFSENSSIEIKNYVLNKNEKRLYKHKDFIILTEKEIQLLQLFFKNKKPISKDNILSTVWNYSSDADTHTVETHIYRLRKKINDKFMDEKFILNDKAGYYL